MVITNHAKRILTVIFILASAAGIILAGVHSSNKIKIGYNTSLAAFVPPANSPLALRQHPRIWLTNSNLAGIKSKIATGGEDFNEFKTFVSWADGNYGSAAADVPFQKAFEAMDYAFLYQTFPVAGVTYGHTQAEYAAKSKELILQFMTQAPDPANGREEYDVALVYDWTYSTLSAQDKVTFLNWMKRIDSQAFANNGVLSDFAAIVWANKVTFGLACYGDGVDDAWCQDGADHYQGWFRDQTGATRARSDLYGDDGGCTQGCAYDMEYVPPMIIMAEESWRTANNISLQDQYGVSSATWLRRLPQKLANIILPNPDPACSASGPSTPSINGKCWIKFNETYGNVQETPYGGEHYFWVSAVSGFYHDIDPNVAGLSQWLLDNRVGDGSDLYTMSQRWVLAKFIAGRKTTPIGPDQILPTSKQFQEGWFNFRTGWNSINDSFVTFLAQKWFHNSAGMGPYNPGGFTVDRKGPQVIRQGFGGHDWGSHGAGSTNTLFFPDRSLSTPPTSEYDDAGGHRRLVPGYGSISQVMVQNSPYDTRDGLRYVGSDSTGDVDYVFSDLTRQYSSTRYTDAFNSTKVSNVTRQFVYFHPVNPNTDSDRIIIFDRANTVDTKFEKDWLFHTAGEPMVNGTQSAGPVRNGSSAGKWTYNNATQVTATNTDFGSNGTTYLTPLLPINRKIVKVGGPDAQGNHFSAGSHEYEDVYGVLTQPPSIHPENYQYVGQYRVEVIPATPSLDDAFLNVVEVGDAGFGKSQTVLLNGSLAAARIGNKIAAFNKVESYVTSGNFTVDAAGTYKALISDLIPNAVYSTSTNGNQTASSAGTLYLSMSVATNASVTLSTTANPPPSPTPPPSPLPTPPPPPPPPAPTPVPGDLNLDHIVNSIDWSIMNSKWFTNDATADLNHDGIVNSIDYSILNANWFKTW